MSNVSTKKNETIYTVELTQDEANLLADILISGVELSDSTKLGAFANDLWQQLSDAGADDSESGVVIGFAGEYLVQVTE